jgi:lipopolysaccharide export system protein LptC
VETPQDKPEQRERLIDTWVKREDNLALLPGLGRHKSQVSFVKVFMLIVALGLVSVLIIWPMSSPVDQRYRVAFDSIETTDLISPEMKNPRFQGVDEKNQPYNVTASVAVQKSEDVVSLEKVNGDITLQDNTWYSVSANKGIIALVKKKLDLTGNVSLFTDEGLEMHTEKAHIDLSAGLAEGSHPVKIQGLLGVLNAQGFKVKERGDVIDFTGPVTMTIFPKT